MPTKDELHNTSKEQNNQPQKSSATGNATVPPRPQHPMMQPPAPRPPGMSPLMPNMGLHPMTPIKPPAQVKPPAAPPAKKGDDE